MPTLIYDKNHPIFKKLKSELIPPLDYKNNRYHPVINKLREELYKPQEMPDTIVDFTVSTMPEEEEFNNFTEEEKLKIKYLDNLEDNLREAEHKIYL